DGQDGDDDAERNQAGDMQDVEQQHLQADVDEDDRQPRLEVDEAMHHVRQQEVHRPESQNGHDAGGEDDEPIGGYGEYRRDRVDGEQQIGELDDDHYQQQGRGHAHAVLDREELLAVVLRRDRDEPAH